MSARLSIAIVGATLVAAMLVGGCGGGEDKPGAQKAGQAADASKCEPVRKPDPRSVKKRRPPNFRLSPQKTYEATVITSCGSFKITLDSRHAPVTGGSFVTLARRGFYDRLSFHSVVTGFVIQGGDPLGNGAGGPGYTIRERPPRDTVYSEGVVAMAKSALDPTGASGSQFFVVTSDGAQLEPVYALLGRVTAGLDVVRRIELVPVGPGDMPVKPVLIKKITIQVR